MFGDGDVLEESKVGCADILSAQSVAADPRKRRAVDNGSGRTVLNPVHRARRCWSPCHEVEKTATRGCRSRACVLADGSEWCGGVGHDGTACVKVSAEVSRRIAQASAHVALNGGIRLATRIAIRGVRLPSAEHMTQQSAL